MSVKNIGCVFLGSTVLIAGFGLTSGCSEPETHSTETSVTATEASSPSSSPAGEETEPESAMFTLPPAPAPENADPSMVVYSKALVSKRDELATAWHDIWADCMRSEGHDPDEYAKRLTFDGEPTPEQAAELEAIGLANTGTETFAYHSWYSLDEDPPYTTDIGGCHGASLAALYGDKYRWARADQLVVQYETDMQDNISDMTLRDVKEPALANVLVEWAGLLEEAEKRAAQAKESGTPIRVRAADGN